MKASRLTWQPPGTPLSQGEADTIRRSIFVLHLVGSLMVLLAVWPPGWRLGEPVLSSPFRSWWRVEVLFLGLLALQLGAGRWRAAVEGTGPAGETSAQGDLLWLFLMVASVLPTGVAAYRVSPVLPAHPAGLAAALGAELFFLMSLGRALRATRWGEPALGLAAWGLFFLLAAVAWVPGLRDWQPVLGARPVQALGPIPFPIVLDQPPVALGPWRLPFPLATAAFWSVTALGARRLARRRHSEERRRGS